MHSRSSTQIFLRLKTKGTIKFLIHDRVKLNTNVYEELNFIEKQFLLNKIGGPYYFEYNFFCFHISKDEKKNFMWNLLKKKRNIIYCWNKNEQKKLIYTCWHVLRHLLLYLIVLIWGIVRISITLSKTHGSSSATIHLSHSTRSRRQKKNSLLCGLYCPFAWWKFHHGTLTNHYNRDVIIIKHARWMILIHSMTCWAHTHVSKMFIYSKTSVRWAPTGLFQTAHLTEVPSL